MSSQARDESSREAHGKIGVGMGLGTLLGRVRTDRLSSSCWRLGGEIHGDGVESWASRSGDISKIGEYESMIRIVAVSMAVRFKILLAVL